MNTPNNIGDILNKLTNVKKIKDNEWQSDCPCGGHKTPKKHLSIGDENTKAVVTCFGGTHTYEDICKSLGFSSLTYTKSLTPLTPLTTLTPKIKEIYKYVNKGKVIYETVRYEPKDFKQRRPDGKGGYIWNLQGIEPFLYHYDEIISAIKNGDTIWVVEGEKDVDRLWDLGLIATCNPMGAGKWNDNYTKTLKNAKLVIIIPDNDLIGNPKNKPTGYNHSLNITKSLFTNGIPVKLVNPFKDFKDVSDYLDSGKTLDDLLVVAEQTTLFKMVIRTTRIGGNSLMEKEFEPIKWVVPTVLPEGMTLLAGTPKTGKSRMALNVGLAVATGGMALDKIKVSKGSVLYISLEDNERRLHEHLVEIFGDTRPDLSKIEFWFETKLINEGGLDDIEEWIKNHTDARLIVVDTLQRIRPKETNGGLYAQDYNAVSPLTELASKYNIAILVIHHLNKRVASDDPMEMISGTTGLTGAVDTTIILKRKRSEAGAVMHIYGRDIEDSDIALDFTGGSWKWLGNEKQVRMSEDRKQIIDLLKITPDLTPKEVSSALQKSSGSIRFLLSKMVADGQLSYFEGKYNAIA